MSPKIEYQTKNSIVEAKITRELKQFTESEAASKLLPNKSIVLASSPDEVQERIKSKATNEIHSLQKSITKSKEMLARKSIQMKRDLKRYEALLGLYEEVADANCDDCEDQQTERIPVFSSFVQEGVESKVKNK